MNVELHIGSKRSGSRFETHCWIVCDGAIQFEVEEVIHHYTKLVAYT